MLGVWPLKSRVLPFSDGTRILFSCHWKALLPPRGSISPIGTARGRADKEGGSIAGRLEPTLEGLQPTCFGPGHYPRYVRNS
jgi:hypothetical protein